MTTALADALDAYRSQLSPDQPAAGHRPPRRRAWLVVVLVAAVLAGGALTMLRGNADVRWPRVADPKWPHPCGL